MSSIKKLASETIWYGASSIFAKFFVQLLTPYLTAEFRGSPDFGKMTLVYAAISFINMGALFGLDYAFFRYIVKKETPRTLFSRSESTRLNSSHERRSRMPSSA